MEQLSNKYTGCIMLSLFNPQWDLIIEECKTDPRVTYIEDFCHVTILYGLDRDIVKQAAFDIKDNVHTWRLRCKPISTAFYNDDKVVNKFEFVQSGNISHLYGLNQYLRQNYDYKNNFPNYNPHITICKSVYDCKFVISDQTFQVNELVYSYKSDNSDEWVQNAITIQ